ncbi:DUF2157 domain-containing protein [Bacteroides xylanisolvens]|nr:DUF2157 domain-containing protein [Bacteroides xylanisolvens]
MEKTDSSPLSRQALYADKKQWNQFLSVFLLAVGVGFTVAGIIFFFAYNWDELPKFAKLGIVEVLLIASVLLVTFTRWNKLVKQILLTGATFLIGTLFAVFGQIYQTGADAYDLFLGWTLFTILWAVATRFAPLWLTFIGLLCTTIWLYNIQIANTNSWEMTLLANAVTWICALATIITEWMSTKGHLDRNNRWFVSLLSPATILHTSFSVNDGNLRRERHIVCSPHKHCPSIFCGTLVWMESKKLVLSGYHSICRINDSIDYIHITKQS